MGVIIFFSAAGATLAIGIIAYRLIQQKKSSLFQEEEKEIASPKEHSFPPMPIKIFKNKKSK